MAEPTPYPVADHGIAHGFTDHESDPTIGGIGGRSGVHHEGRPGDPDPAPGRPPEILRAAHPQLPRQHRRRRPGLPQADSSARPLRRRAATMARPARVRIRCRKPWVRLRRRLLGWNVRLVTGGLPYLRMADERTRAPFRTHSARVRWVAGVAADSDLLTVRGRAKGVKPAAIVGIVEPAVALSSRHAERPANIPDRLALQHTGC